MYPRAVEALVRDALADTPAVLVVGPRQGGKSTLVTSLLDDSWTYLTLDDAGPLAAARSDPAGFLAGHGGPLAIDEIQKAPELLPAIKARIDRDRRPGRFLLTGSANVLALPRVSESLAGRMEVITLWPLGQHEIEAAADPAPFLRALPEGLLPGRVEGASTWRERAIGGGFPESVARTRAVRRTAWFDSYLTTILARDVRDVADIAGVAALPRLVRLLASRSGGLANVADVGRSLELPATTLKRYLSLLESIFVVRSLPPWHAKLARRLVKTPKLYVADSGLLAHLLGVTSAEEIAEHDGMLLETFAVMEIVKQAAAVLPHVECTHFRTHEGHEVDVVVEDSRRRLYGVEIKATRTPRADDFRGLRILAESAGSRFTRGVLLYGGEETIPFAANLHAVPISSLWTSPRG